MTKKPGDYRLIHGGGKTGLARAERVLYLAVLLLVMFLLFQAGYHWISGWILSYRVQMEVAEPGKLRQSLETKGIITRNEKIVKAPREGVFFKKVSQGKRVGVGSEIGFLVAGDYNKLLEADSGKKIMKDRWYDYWRRIHISTSKAGVISYGVDGLEGYGPGNYPYFKLVREEDTGGSEIEKTKEGKESSSVEEQVIVEKGDPLFRVIDNWEWYFSVAICTDRGTTVATEEDVVIKFSFAPEREVTGEKIDKEVDEDEDKIYLTYRVNKDLHGFYQARSSRAHIYYKEYQGVKIPEKAILEDKEGVYVNRGGVVTYQPVETLYTRGDKAVVEGVEPYSMVISRPELVDEGERLE